MLLIRKFHVKVIINVLARLKIKEAEIKVTQIAYYFHNLLRNNSSDEIEPKLWGIKGKGEFQSVAKVELIEFGN